MKLSKGQTPGEWFALDRRFLIQSWDDPYHWSITLGPNASQADRDLVKADLHDAGFKTRRDALLYLERALQA